MPETITEVRGVLNWTVSHGLSLVVGLVTLMAGWLIALAVSGLCRRILSSTRVGKAVEFIVSGDAGLGLPRPEKWLPRVVFYLLMAGFFFLFFEVLGFSLARQTVGLLAERFGNQLPRLTGPAVLLVLVWPVAFCVRWILSRILESPALNQFMCRYFGLELEFQKTVAKTLSLTIYWVVFLIFFLAVLDALELRGVLEPLRELVKRLLEFAPEALVSGCIFLFGWFLAKVVQHIVTNLLSSIGTDRLSEDVGLQSLMGRHSLARFLGLAAYVIVFIPTLIASLTALKLQEVTEPAILFLNRCVALAPSIVSALLLMGIAFVVGRTIAGLSANLLANAGFNQILARLGVAKDPTDFNSILSKLGVGDEKITGTRTLSDLAGALILLVLMLLASVESLSIVGFTGVSDILAQFISFLGKVFLGLVIFTLGLWIARRVAKAIQVSGSRQGKLIGDLSYWAILALAVAMSLQQAGIDREILRLAFTIVLGAVAVAMAIAFGLGSREVAGQISKEIWQGFKTRLKERDVQDDHPRL